jgi:hypothetical protein
MVPAVVKTRLSVYAYVGLFSRGAVMAGLKQISAGTDPWCCGLIDSRREAGTGEVRLSAGRGRIDSEGYAVSVLVVCVV